MEFIRYTSKSNIKDLKNHSINLKEFIENTDFEKEDWSSLYEVKITINEGDLTI